MPILLSLKREAWSITVATKWLRHRFSCIAGTAQADNSNCFLWRYNNGIINANISFRLTAER
jgi:hypothetical protein